MLLETFPPRAEFRTLLDSASVVPVGARILADTHAAARQVVGSKLQEINR